MTDTYMPTRQIVADEIFDEERALYALCDATVSRCVFDGPADGESAFKEAARVQVEDCIFRLRYPFWHVHGGELARCTMTDTCRAALWYAEDMTVRDCTLGGIKALRECDRMNFSHSTATSDEFGWLCRDLAMTNCSVAGNYPFFMTRDLVLEACTLKGKYSFQYVENCTVRDCCLDTKDAFWHAKRVTVTDSTIKGEYLGWYSEDLTLIRCHLVGTQPLCYCKRLTLIDCTTEGCDLAFENSEVTATITGGVDSIKSPAAGSIVADRIGEIIHDRAPVDGQGCRISVRD